MPTTEQKDKIVKDTYTEIKTILGLLKSVKKLSNDVVSAQIAHLLTDELKAVHQTLNDIIEGN